jgi:serine phosphatase RsbU (regulator of sigma subunit)
VTHEHEPDRDGRLEDAVDRMARAAANLQPAATLREALQAIVEASAAATRAESAVVRVLDPGDGRLEAAAVVTSSRARTAEIEGTRVAVEEIAAHEIDQIDGLPPAVRRVAERSRSRAVLQLPISLGGGPVATLELLRAANRFTPPEVALARLAAAQVGLCLRAFKSAPGVTQPPELHDLAGEALAAGTSEEGEPDRLARLAADAWGADAALLWRREGKDETVAPIAGFGLAAGPAHSVARRLAEKAQASGDFLVIERKRGHLPEGFALSATVPLGRPPLGLLQLLFVPGSAPDDERLLRLTAFGVHAARALRASDRSHALSLELERSRALLGVLGQATAELSLSHTLATALDRIGGLLAVDRIGVYLKEGETLLASAESGLAGPHTVVAAQLLELALGPARARGALVVEDARADPRLAGVKQAIEETGIDSALVVPLVASEEVIGLIAAYPASRRGADEAELALLNALAGQLAVAVQNARLHEQAKQLGEELEHALSAERKAGRRLRALYDVSRSFVHSLSFEATLEAVARAAVESLSIDAAVLRVPDPRGEALVTQALHVADPRLEPALRAMLSREQVISRPALEQLFSLGEPLSLDRSRAQELGGPFELLIPFLDKGSTAIVVPVATPSEVLATLTLISLDPARPIDAETAQAAMSLAGQGALAVENALLYQQQKQFTDSMQRSLLPRVYPEIEGVDLGVVYESSGRMDVGGDVYDFMALDDGRLAVVLGDVMGHGIDAAADMAMTKFVFRSLAREHPEPEAFLAHANDVVAGEIAPGKFITLVYLTVDPFSWEVACAAGGHPAPRLVGPDGSVEEVGARGVALGIEVGQRYREVRWALPDGASIVLFTDGVVEARRESELYGTERLDALIAEKHSLSAQSLAEALVEDCRRFGDGELADDCAVVVVRREGAAGSAP